MNLLFVGLFFKQISICDIFCNVKKVFNIQHIFNAIKKKKKMTIIVLREIYQQSS